jgi:8-oxo-dGTP diphosphatase/2-hydroxy-dATP diphosphatase
MIKKTLTLGLIYDGSRILLGMKKRGFGSGRYNGFGGKVEIARGETIEEAVDREFLEECGITVLEKRKRGKIDFIFQGKEEYLEVNIYQILKYSGTPIETDEMMPEWFDVAKIPYEKMWPDDSYWMPKFLDGKNVSGTCWFKDMDTIERFELNEEQA